MFYSQQYNVFRYSRYKNMEKLIRDVISSGFVFGITLTELFGREG